MMMFTRGSDACLLALKPEELGVVVFPKQDAVRVLIGDVSAGIGQHPRGPDARGHADPGARNLVGDRRNPIDMGVEIRADSRIGPSR
jgi:hypothetical protein